MFGLQQVRVELTQSVWVELLNSAVGTLPLETGGILMGEWETDRMARVFAVIGPGPKATRTRSSFDPDQQWQEDEMACIWEEHSGNIGYLGDWHTHPGKSTQPSRLDTAATREIAVFPAARAPKPLLLIIGASNSGIVRPTAYVLAGRRLRKVVLSIDWGSKQRSAL